ncbi:MAG: NAD(P)/FAD-dependent oxidoreductase [Bacteroidia bacterium]
MHIRIPETDKPRVVIIGGGFGGITLGRALRKAPVQVVMFDKNNYHTFQPLLYQVATGGLEPDSIAFPLRKLFESQDNFYFRMAEVERIDPEENRIHTTLGPLHYDYLVMATGSKTNFFGMEGVERNSLGLKSAPEALDLRSLILQNFEKANIEADEKTRARLLNFVIVGGGPTGVETAGALAEIRRHILPKDYPEMDNEAMNIHLVEAADRLLGGMSQASSDDAVAVLEKMGVHVHLNTLVSDYDGKTVSTKDPGVSFDAETVVWSAGVKGALIEGLSEESMERGRLRVDAYCRVKGYDNIYAVGDVALMKTDSPWPKGHPQVAQVAIQMGELFAENLKKLLKGEEVEPFSYFDKGSMATIGRNKAVVDMGKRHLKGFIAWMAWMFVHLFYLIGFRNKVVVFANWVWSYFTYDKGTRLIIRPYQKAVSEPSAQKEVHLPVSP